MKRKMGIGIALFLITLCSIFFIQGKVDAATVYNDEISYEEEYDGTITVRAAGEYIEKATIPSTINGKTVTKIDYSGFQNCKYLETVTLPSTIKEIEAYAFEGCTSLTSINIPSQVKTIPYWAFQNCSSLRNINLSNVTKIEPYAFNGCSSLTSVTFSANLQSIGDGAFKDTKALKTVNLPSQLTYLGDSAFEASGLTSITIPTSVKEMPSNYGAFENCKSLKTATINASVTKIPYNLFKDCTALTTVKFSSSSPVINFDRYVFSGCSSLTNVTLPPKLQNISNYCFENCTALTTITIPDTVTTIGVHAFSGCSKLSSIKIPYGVKEIQQYAFSDCTSLKNIYFTKSIQEIEKWAFENCSTSNLKIYGYSGTAAKYFAQENGYSFTECTPVSSIKISGNTSVVKKSSVTLKANVSPTNAYNKTVKWSSSNPSIASVSSSGVVTGKAIGTATITAMATDGTGAKGTYIITVKATDLPFKDVTVDEWYYGAIKYTYQKGIIKGANDTEFKPNVNISRGMMVTILWRMVGEPKITGGKSFPDVKTSDYYYNAVKWASAKGIVNGYNSGKFAPNDDITREQLAVILQNYSKYMKRDVSKTTNLSKFKDGYKTTGYAQPAVKWAVATGVISGKDKGTRLDPQGTATRAEAAAMIYNYFTKIK